MSQTNEIARVVLAHPGLDAAEIMDLAKGVESGTTCASALKWLTDKGVISRARIDGRFCYWPPGKAPATVGEPVREKGWPGVNIDRAHKAANKGEDALPGVDKIHKRGVNRAEAATSGDRSAGRGHTNGGGAAANLRSAAPGSEARSPGAHGGPQPPLPIPRRPAEAMKAGGRTSAGPSPGETQPGRPATITTPDWMLYPIEDGLIVMHKDTDTGFRLDAETVAAIKELV